MEKQNYLHPITFEAELFVNSLETLSKTYNNIDAILVRSLEKVMNAIENFLDSSPTEIVATENTDLVKCVDIGHIKRIYHCESCKQDLGKSAEKVTLHLTKNCIHCGSYGKSSNDQGAQRVRNDSVGKRNAKKEEPRSAKPIKLTKKTVSLLTSDLSQFILDQAKLCKKLTCLPAYSQIKEELEKLIVPLFPNKNVKIYQFGSRIAGIGTRESDLDLYIDIDDTFNILENKVNNETLTKLKKVSNALKNSNKSWKGLVTIASARVPIVKVMHVATGIECDINFSNSLGTINTRFLEFIFDLQPIAQLLCSFMKKWINRTSFNSNINTYSVSLMVLFYLQTLEVVPSMKQLQENVNLQKVLHVGPWLCTYAALNLNELNMPLKRVDQPSLLEFIRGFFLYYTNLRFDKYVISPYLGKLVEKHDLETEMPLRYKNFVKENPNYALELDKPLVVQDPIQLNHNTTKNLSESILKTLKAYMSCSLELLNNKFVACD